MIYLILFIFGLCLGSFVNALVYRIHEQTKKGSKRPAQSKQLSILHGRSMCPHCKHELGVADLVPVFSWLGLRGKCRYCKWPISWQYPLVELATGLLFVGSYIYWPEPLGGLQILVLVLWLICLVGLMALIVYDLRWMLLPNRIIFPLYVVAAIFVITQIVDTNSLTPALQAIYGILIGGGIFYLLFQLSEGRWIGGGDVKLGFLLGALVGGPVNAVLLLFIASLMGSLVSVPLLVGRQASGNTRIPFGPFLIVAAFIVQLFGQGIVGWYSNYFLY